MDRRRWLDEAAFADLVALSQFLPGPASSQLGIAIGTRRAGIAGGFAAWLGFTVPSAIAMIGFALLLTNLDLANAGWVHGLKLAAVAVVAQAIWAMTRVLTPDPARQAMAVAAAAVALAWGSPIAQVALIAAGGLAGRLLLAPTQGSMAGPTSRAIPRPIGVAALALFIGLLVGLPLLAGGGRGLAALFASFYTAGALTFGGGHVVLPLLHAAVAGQGWVTDGQFLAGYGAAQAVPGPLFTIAAFLGAVALIPAGPSLTGPAGQVTTGGIVGGLFALVAIFLPSFLLVFGALPFWDRLRRSPGFRRALAGTNAAVVGILAAAFIDPIWTGAIRDPSDVGLAGGALAVLATRRVPPIVVVLLLALAGQVLARR